MKKLMISFFLYSISSYGFSDSYFKCQMNWEWEPDGIRKEQLKIFPTSSQKYTAVYRFYITHPETGEVTSEDVTTLASDMKCTFGHTDNRIIDCSTPTQNSRPYLESFKTFKTIETQVFENQDGKVLEFTTEWLRMEVTSSHFDPPFYMKEYKWKISRCKTTVDDD